MKKVILFCQLLGMFSIGMADDFRWKTQIDSVLENGFYKIILGPEIRSKSRTDGQDFRIFDSKHKEIPYLFVAEKKETEQTQFKPYTILENFYNAKKKQTRVVVQNTDKSTISSFVLQIRNSEIEKEITLKGSDNNKDWFIIKRNFLVLSSNNLGKTSELKIIDFPKSNYSYFEITLNDKQKDPLQIMAVGNYSSEVNQGLYTKIPTPTISQTNDLKHKKSFVKVQFSDTFEIDRISLQLSGPGYYQRNCNIGVNKEVNHTTTFYSIHSFVLTSERQSQWEVGNLNARELIIEIDNEDNEPVKVKSIEAYQLTHYLIAELTKKETYELFWSSPKVQTPNYDLKYFTEKIPAQLQVLKTGSLIPIEIKNDQHGFSIFDKRILWIALVIVAGIVGWITIKITREMKINAGN